MSAYSTVDPKIAGLKHGLDSRVISMVCKDSSGIEFGRPVFGYAGDDTGCYGYKNDRGILTFSTDLSASNSTVITVNGTAVTAVVFATDHDTTMAAIAAQIEADISGANATVSAARVIHVDIDGVEMTVSGVVTGGSAVTIAATYASRQVFLGMSLLTHIESAVRTNLSGTVIDAATAKYNDDDTVPIMVNGWVYAATGGAVVSNSAAYAVISGTYIGTIDDASTAVSLTGLTILEDVSAAGIALCRVNK